MIDVTDHTTRWNPNNSSDDYHGSHYIIFEETHNFVDVYVFNDVPKSFHYILNRFLTNTLEECVTLSGGLSKISCEEIN